MQHTKEQGAKPPPADVSYKPHRGSDWENDDCEAKEWQTQSIAHAGADYFIKTRSKVVYRVLKGVPLC